MTAVDRIKCRYAHSGMTSGVGGFQNSGVCLQAFPPFLPHSLPAYSRHFSRGLCSETARKRLLRRLVNLLGSCFPVKGMSHERNVICSAVFEIKSHLLDNLSNCLMNLKNSGDSTGFEPMTCALPVQCSNQLSYEVTQWRAGQFVGLMFISSFDFKHRTAYNISFK